MITSKNRIYATDACCVERGRVAIGLAVSRGDAVSRHDPRGRNDALAPRRLLLAGRHAARSSGGRPAPRRTTCSSDMMSPLNPYKDRMMFLDGLDYVDHRQMGVGHPHSRGMAGVLTGTKLLPGDIRDRWWRCGLRGRRRRSIRSSRPASAGTEIPVARVLFGLVDLRSFGRGGVVRRRPDRRMAASKKPIAPDDQRDDRRSPAFSASFRRPIRPPRRDQREDQVDPRCGARAVHQVSAKLGAADRAKLHRASRNDPADGAERDRDHRYRRGELCTVPPMPTSAADAHQPDAGRNWRRWSPRPTSPTRERS